MLFENVAPRRNIDETDNDIDYIVVWLKALINLPDIDVVIHLCVCRSMTCLDDKLRRAQVVSTILAMFRGGLNQGNGMFTPRIAASI